jgi:PAS domain S-box-containing protein
MFRSTRNQILIILSLFFVIVFVGYFLFWKVNANKIIQLVDEMKLGKMVLLEKTIEFKSKNLVAFTNDYTYWDEMVTFVKEGDPEWAKENIEASMPTYEIDYTWIYKPNLQYCSAFSGENLPKITNLPIDAKSLLLLVDSARINHFYLCFNNNVIEISSASIHPTYDQERITTPQGYLFAGRILSDIYLNDIGIFTGGTVELDLPKEGRFEEINRKGEFDLVSTKYLPGFNNEPVARVRSTYNYTIVEDFILDNRQRTIYGALIILLCMIGFFTFFGLKVYNPLGTLVKSLKTGDIQILDKISLQKDEFGQLSLLINNFFKQKNKLQNEIEERNQVETLLIKLSQAIEQSPATIIITGVDGNIEYVNPKFTTVTGYKLDEVIGKNPRFLKTGKKSKEEYKQMWETIHKGEVWRGEFGNRKKNGEIYYESAIISPIFDEKGIITNFLAINEDITEKKHEETIRNIIFEIAKAGSVSKNLEELIEQIRVHLSQLIDVTNFYIALYDESTDMFTLPLFLDQKDDISAFKAEKTLTAYVLKTKKSFLGHKKDIDELKKAGLVDSIGESAKVWLGVPLIVDDKPMGVFTVQSYDNEKAFSEKDKDMLEFVSHEISHTIQRIKAEEEIISALERAEQSDKLKSIFLANISHEIRTPLNSILGFTKLMADPEVDTVKKYRFSRIIKNNGDQLLSIINGLLDFSLIETGQIKLLKKKFIAEKVIQEIRNEYTPMATEKEIEILLDQKIITDETTLESDLSRFKQVISNLVDNAIKFTGAGTIEIGLHKEKDSMLIFVKDTGIGIPLEFQKNIFEQFQQADKSNARKFGGNGLGLAISKYFIELMGGKIWVESEVGKGSTFYIQIPYIMSTPKKFLKD